MSCTVLYTVSIQSSGRAGGDTFRRPMAPTALVLGLVRAVAAFEEWSLVDAAPLREVVVVRAHYAPSEDREALLPATLTADALPAVTDASTGRPLPVRRAGPAWAVTLPARAGTLRVIARIERPAISPRAFALRWPPPGDPGARRVATLPRAWSSDEPDGWTCPGLDPEERVCVSHGAATSFRVRAPAAPSPRGAWSLALALIALSVAWAPRLGRDRVEARLAAVGGAAVGAAVALSLVGARALSWGVALALCAPLGAALGAVATRRRGSRVLGSAALAALPLTVALGAGVDAVVALALGAACAVLAPFSSPSPSR